MSSLFGSGRGLRRGIRRRFAGPALITAVLVGAMVPSAASAGVANVDLHVALDDCWILGTARPHRTITIGWRSATRALKLKQTVRSGPDGSWSTRCTEEQVESGDTIRAVIGANSRTFTVPRLTLQVDREHDTISGKSLPDTKLAWEVYGWDAVSDGVVITDAAGAFSLDVSGEVDILGADGVHVDLRSGDDRVRRFRVAPAVEVYRGRSDLRATGDPGQSALVELARGSETKSEATVGFDRFGGAWTDFTDPDGEPVRVAAGDTVRSLDLGIEFVVPRIAVSGEPSTDRVTGSCPPGSAFELEAHSLDLIHWAFRDGTTPPSGTFTRDLTVDMDLRAGHVVDLVCRLDTGDRVGRRIVVP